MELEYPLWLNLWLQIADTSGYTVFRLLSMLVALPLFLVFWFRGVWAGLQFFVNLTNSSRLRELTISFLIAWVVGFSAAMFGWGAPMWVGLHYQMPQCDMDKLVLGKIKTNSCIAESSVNE